MIDRSNKTWNKEISDEDIFEREFTTAFLLQTNEHIPLLKELKEKLLSTYNVRAEFIYMGYNGENIYCNGQRLVWRERKNSNFSVGKNVKVIEHNFSTNGGGSNKYPSVRFNGAKCTLEFISYGLPYVDKLNGWKINIIELVQI